MYVNVLTQLSSAVMQRPLPVQPMGRHRHPRQTASPTAMPLCSSMRSSAPSLRTPTAQACWPPLTLRLFLTMPHCAYRSKRSPCHGIADALLLFQTEDVGLCCHVPLQSGNMQRDLLTLQVCHGAGLTSFLMNGNTSQTVFAPINSAWKGQPDTHSSRALTNLMLFHMALGTFLSSLKQLLTINAVV